MSARLASDLHARRINPTSSSLFHSLSLINLFPRSLPHVPRTCELRLSQLHFSLRQLSHSLGVSFLHSRQSNLLSRLPLQRFHAATARRLGFQILVILMMMMTILMMMVFADWRRDYAIRRCLCDRP